MAADGASGIQGPSIARPASQSSRVLDAPTAALRGLSHSERWGTPDRPPDWNGLLFQKPVAQVAGAHSKSQTRQLSLEKVRTLLLWGELALTTVHRGKLPVLLPFAPQAPADRP